MKRNENNGEDRNNKDVENKTTTLEPVDEKQKETFEEQKGPKNKPVVDEEEEQTEETTVHESIKNENPNKEIKNEADVVSGENRELDELEEELNGSEQHTVTNKNKMEKIVNKKS